MSEANWKYQLRKIISWRAPDFYDGSGFHCNWERAFLTTNVKSYITVRLSTDEKDAHRYYIFFPISISTYSFKRGIKSLIFAADQNECRICSVIHTTMLPCYWAHMSGRGFDSHLVPNLHAATVWAMLCACVIPTARDRLRRIASEMLSSQLLKRKGDEYKKFHIRIQPVLAPDLLNR